MKNQTTYPLSLLAERPQVLGEVIARINWVREMAAYGAAQPDAVHIQVDREPWESTDDHGYIPAKEWGDTTKCYGYIVSASLVWDGEEDEWTPVYRDAFGQFLYWI